MSEGNFEQIEKPIVNTFPDPVSLVEKNSAAIPKAEQVQIGTLKYGHELNHTPSSKAIESYGESHAEMSDDPIIISLDNTIVDGNGRYGNRVARGNRTIDAIKLPLTDKQIFDLSWSKWDRQAHEFSYFVYKMAGYNKRAEYYKEKLKVRIKPEIQLAIEQAFKNYSDLTHIQDDKRKKLLPEATPQTKEYQNMVLAPKVETPASKSNMPKKIIDYLSSIVNSKKS